MLLHLPIVILATLSPIAVSDTPPKFDVVRECQHEGGAAADLDRCSRDEGAALAQLKNECARFVVPDKSTCMKEATMADFTSNVELLTCLEMASEVGRKDRNPRDPGTSTKSVALQLARPAGTVGVGHDLIRLRIKR